MALHIVVCMKVVPKPEEVRVDPNTRTLDRAKARSEINPPDMNALEAALHLRDEHGGRVFLISMGPPFAEDYLRLALAMGADHGYLLSDRAFGGADTLATSYTLAQGIRKIGPFDIILCGEESSDGATAQVPPGIAEWLGISQITYAMGLSIAGGRLRGQRELRGGHEVIEVPLPAVASIKVGINEPRFIEFDRWSWAQEEGRVTVWGIHDLDVDPEMIGLPGSPTVVAGLGQAAASSERRREFIDGSPEEAAQALFQRIKELLPV